MKVLRILLIAVIFSVLLVSSPAQAQSGQVGYIALLRQANPNLSFYTQARQAFDRLAPKLLAAQRSGSILNFVPDFSAGIVAIYYTSRAGLTSSVDGLTVFDDVQGAAASVPHDISMQRDVSVNAAPQFSLTLNSSCVDMSGLGNNTRVVGNLKDSASKLLAAFEGYADATGNLRGCFSNFGSYKAVMPGYSAFFNLYVGGNLTSYSILVPVINITSFDKANSILLGTAPASKPFSATLSHPYLNDANTVLSVKPTGTIPASGAWSIDFGAVPFRGGDDLSITVTSTANFSFTRWFTIPYFYCALGGNFCGVYGMPNQATTLTITHASVAYNFTGKFDYSGWFSGSLYDAQGLPIFLVANDTVGGTGMTTYSLPALTAGINFAADLVNGKAPVSTYFWVFVYDMATNSQHSIWSHADAAGNYQTNFSSILNMDPTSAYSVKVYYVDQATGNDTYTYITYAPISCYALTRTHTGNGSDPAASPVKSAGCSANYTYVAGQSITLTASPASGAGIGKWTGTANDASLATTNTLVMPASNTAVKVSYTTTASYISRAAEDGWVLESTETSNIGGSINNAATTFYLGDTATKKQYRGILSFNTAPLPDTAVLTAAVLKVQKESVVGGGNPVTLFQGFMVDIAKGFFGTTALQVVDFQAADHQSYGPFNTALAGGWYNINLTVARGYINPFATNSGLTQIRLRFKLDDNDDNLANYLSLYSGNAVSASRPQLVVTYYLP